VLSAVADAMDTFNIDAQRFGRPSTLLQLAQTRVHRAGYWRSNRGTVTMHDPHQIEVRLSACRWPLTLLLVGLLGCSTRGTELDDARQPETSLPDPKPASGDEKEQPMRVLVTGFNDWRELGDPPNVWRCRDNPSCRLLLGEPQTSPPSDYGGPLVERLRARAPDIEWRFATMPVTWGVASPVPTDVDVIVNIGLGIYDRFDALQLEVGAYNARKGTDAAGITRAEPIAPTGPTILAAPAGSPILANIQALAGRTISGYEILAAEARVDNTYLCNETHHGALAALHAGEGRLEAVYFLHIPYLESGVESGDFEPLADGVAAVVLSLVGRE
jgi:hypothetical protein